MLKATIMSWCTKIPFVFAIEMVDLSIGNSIISSAITDKQARVSF